MDRALVLAGGGSRGSFQAPIIDGLNNQGFDFEYIFGVSAGAINGSVASTKTKNITSLWRDIKRDDVFSGPVNSGFFGKVFRAYKILMGNKNSIYSNEKLIELLKKHYNPEETKIPYAFGSTSLINGEFKTFAVYPDSFENENISQNSVDISNITKEKIYKLIVSSASIPVILPPIFGEYVDGGLKDMAPIGAAIEKDVDEIIIVPTEKISETRNYNTETSSGIFNIAKTALNIILDETLVNDYKIANKINNIVKQAKSKGCVLKKENGEKYKHINIEVIEPSIEMGSSFNFDKNTIERRIKHGQDKFEDFIKNYQN